jgi:hypothetical protein
MTTAALLFFDKNLNYLHRSCIIYKGQFSIHTKLIWRKRHCIFSSLLDNPLWVVIQTTKLSSEYL